MIPARVPLLRLVLLLSVATAYGDVCSFEMQLVPLQQARKAESDVSSQEAGRSLIECATLCVTRSSCRWFDFHERLQRCCLADRPVQCWSSETKTDDSFGELTDTCCSTVAEMCADQFVSGDTRHCVIMQRVSDSVPFRRTWAEYENGFGDNQNWWIGLKSIHALTCSSSKTLRVEMTSWNDSSFFCEHPNFKVYSWTTNYKMTVSPFLKSRCSVNFDAMSYHSGMQFSTIDVDNDDVPDFCSRVRGGGGWWYRSCMYPNPTGIYSEIYINFRQNMFWVLHPNRDVPMREIKLMVSLSP